MKAELLAAVRLAVGAEAYSDMPAAAEHALKNDRAALATHLGIQVAFDRSLRCYRLTSLGETPWLDLDDDALAAIAVIYTTFTSGGPEAERVRTFLDQIAACCRQNGWRVSDSRRSRSCCATWTSGQWPRACWRGCSALWQNGAGWDSTTARPRRPNGSRATTR